MRKPKYILGPVRIEALRLARIAIKDALRKQGEKISNFKSSDITRTALELIRKDKSIMNQAKKNCRELLSKRKRK